jgi:hypothetical protein
MARVVFSGDVTLTSITRKTIALLLTVTMFLTMACGIVNSLVGGSAGIAGDLWADVPPFPGVTKANMDLPLPLKLIVQSAFQGKLEFISYTTTKAPADIQAFYTTDRMKASGWNTDSGGCTTGSSSSTSNGDSIFCFFGKKDGTKEYGLAIIANQEAKTKETQIFYVRINITSTPTPKP